MGGLVVAVEPVAADNFEATARFLAGWVIDGEAEAREYLANHAEPEGASLIATRGSKVLAELWLWAGDGQNRSRLRLYPC